MNITIDTIQQIFAKYNQLCFDSQLPTPLFRLGNAKNYLGQLKYRKKKNANGNITHFDFALWVNTRYAMDEGKLTDVVVHEMIHYYIAYRHLPDNSSHGAIFTKIMTDINTRFGLHISISTNESLLAKDDTQQYQTHIVCVAQLKDGATGVSVCARSRMFEIDDDLHKFYPIKHLTWYFTISPYFNRYPRSNKAKLYIADKDEVNAQLSDALELERVGNVFRPKKG